jgi:hypothetical protein
VEAYDMRTVIENITQGKSLSDVFADGDMQRITNYRDDNSVMSIVEQQVNVFNSGAKPGETPGTIL